MFLLCVFSVMCFVFVGFGVMCEVPRLSFVYMAGCVLLCLLSDCVCILCRVTFRMLCYCVTFCCDVGDLLV